MKHIIKHNSPKSLEDYKKEENACFNNIPPNVKEELRKSLFEEQGGICCYCEDRIYPDHRSVLEHLLPKGLKQYSNLQLSYSNLLCSCDGGEFDRYGKTKKQKKVYPPHCDSKKNNKTIDITPLNNDCEDYFTYDEDGNIWGTNETANKTIDIMDFSRAKGR